MKFCRPARSATHKRCRRALQAREPHVPEIKICVRLVFNQSLLSPTHSAKQAFEATRHFLEFFGRHLLRFFDCLVEDFD